jgi:hypothetical protein
MGGIATALAALLAPYADPDPEMGRLVNVPPDVAAQALALVPNLAGARMNGQPEQSWLVQAAADLDGWLCGSLAPGRACLRFDAIQVPVARARELAERITAVFPRAPDHLPALDTAVAEAWLVRDALDPVWTGDGTELLTDPLPSGVQAVGLWWD